ncbi:crosslink repair DNA glycosylase YcaQ family protein [Nocardioides sp. GY 10127]|uniref:DNA glycosylase AlkZ-like family protein n=1 Tax=Nocardioides sp. GY 10127 TaxID=2569762 RepID=UPI0010A77947|nr:crosslink repair DNA glycosylase YcaQ family protein [Nocardioides sp. GY 10127]TIC78686.1 winged helix-turn-helix domain-containing protein [Nocardioides sp. GY 10127]TIC81034.1 winged helix-turn-helix domain-containing protein [Nocardioides sp. GY 10127]
MPPPPAHRLSRAEARRVAVRAQLLTGRRPGDVLEVVRHLGVLQLDPTRHVAPSAHLVLWSRLGSGYDREELDDLLAGGALVEIGGYARPAEDVRLHTAEMAAWPGTGELSPWQQELAAWVEDNDGARLETLELLRQDGPLAAPDLPRGAIVRPWRSSGWNDDRSLLRLLDLMAARGEVAVVGRQGQHRLWDLAERVLPDDEPVPPAEALAERARRRLAALGVARARAAVAPGEPHDVGASGEPASIEGVRGTWRVDPTLLDAHADSFLPRTALLSPLDRLVMDRKRMAELWGFDYQLEMYKPASARRWGYWALPVLHGEDLVGKVDAQHLPLEGTLLVRAVHEDAPWPASLREDVDAELADLAAWLDAEVVRA